MFTGEGGGSESIWIKTFSLKRNLKNEVEFEDEQNGSCKGEVEVGSKKWSNWLQIAHVVFRLIRST